MGAARTLGQQHEQAGEGEEGEHGEDCRGGGTAGR